MTFLLILDFPDFQVIPYPFHSFLFLPPCHFSGLLTKGAQTGIKISGRNINNLRYGDKTILVAESEEELKNLLMKVKENSEKAGLKLKIKKKKT